MNFNHFRIFIPFISLALIVLIIVIVPGSKIHIQTLFLFFIIVAAVLIASHLPITMQKRMKGYAVVDTFFMDIALIFGALFIGLLLYLQGDNTRYAQIYDAGMSGLLTGGLILCIVGGIRLHRAIDLDHQDERSKKCGGWGFAYSWYLTYFFIVFTLLAYALGLPLPSVEILLLLLILIMPISAYVLQSYFYRKEAFDT
jgi:hypothetical protein